MVDSADRIRERRMNMKYVYPLSAKDEARVHFGIRLAAVVAIVLLVLEFGLSLVG